MSDVTKEPAGAFMKAVKSATVGDEITYHVGEFASGLHKKDAYASYERGEVVLIQRRLAPRQFAYVAVRTRKK
jgi:hypothetical protein